MAHSRGTQERERQREYQSCPRLPCQMRWFAHAFRSGDVSILDGTSPTFPFGSLLHQLESLVVIVGGRERRARPIAVEVRVAGVRRVVVDHDVPALDVVAMYEPVGWHPVTKFVFSAPGQVGSHHGSLMELLELPVPGDALLLVQARVDRNRREVAFDYQLVGRGCPLNRLHEDDDLVEFEAVEHTLSFLLPAPRRAKAYIAVPAHERACHRS